jgi:hypothetical protein
MQRLWNVRVAVFCGVAVLGAMMLSSANQAEARPQNLKQFMEQYPNVAEAKDVKCGVCHPVTDKKERNDYGMALGKAIGTKNEKDVELIKAAMTKIESEKSATDGKTFGDLLKAGKLPGKK